MSIRDYSVSNWRGKENIVAPKVLISGSSSQKLVDVLCFRERLKMAPICRRMDVIIVTSRRTTKLRAAAESSYISIPATSTTIECDDVPLNNGRFLNPLYFRSVFREGNVFRKHPECEKYFRSPSPIPSHAALTYLRFYPEATIVNTLAMPAEETPLEGKISEAVVDYSKSCRLFHDNLNRRHGRRSSAVLFYDYPQNSRFRWWHLSPLRAWFFPLC